MDELRILIFAANPSRDLRLDDEIRAIESELRESSHRDRVRLIPALAARPGDLIDRLSNDRPTVVHFSAHGLGGSDAGAGMRSLTGSTDAPEAQIVLVDEATGTARPVGQKALVNLFRVRRGGIRLVVLNACFTRPQAEAISEVIDCVIGTNRAIGDQAARVFSARFYHTLADGDSIQQAFDDARVELELHGIPESATPVLLCRSGVDPAQVVLVGPETVVPIPPGPGPRLSAEAASRLDARLKEVRRSIARVDAVGTSNYLNGQLVEINERIRRGSEPETDLKQAVETLWSSSETLVSLQDLEHAIDRKGKFDGSDELLGLVRRARVEAINERLKEADRLRLEVEGKLADAGVPERPSTRVEHHRPRVLEPGEDARKAIPWLWDNGSVIRVAFLDGTPDRQELIMDAAGEWSQYANLTFKVVEDRSQADIRIATGPPDAPPGSFYSYLGTMARDISGDGPTAGIGLTPDMSRAQMRRSVLFVFGHVLGLLSEHTNPNCRDLLRFKSEPEVMKFFEESYGWPEEAVRQFLYAEGYPAKLTAYRSCDMYSIMMHKLPPQVIENAPPELLELSDGDKAFVRRLYPRD